MPINLPENGSVFVVFRKPAQPRHLVLAPTPDQGVEIDGRDNSKVEFNVWKA